MKNINKYIPYKNITGEGGLHVFIELDDRINVNKLLELCEQDGVSFIVGNIFYESFNKKNTMRLGFGKVKEEHIEKGIKIIGEKINNLLKI